MFNEIHLPFNDEYSLFGDNLIVKLFAIPRFGLALNQRIVMFSCNKFVIPYVGAGCDERTR